MNLFWQAAFPPYWNLLLSSRCWKKISLDTENLKNYKRVSNLPFLSKVTQQIALLQLSHRLESNNLLYSLQFAYCPDHNTETVLLNIVSDLLAAPDINHISLLSLPIRRFWHYRPLHSTHQTPPYFWHFWHCSVLVSFIPLWLNSGHLCQWCCLHSSGLKLPCPPGVSAWSYSLCPLHSSYFWDCILSLHLISLFF